MTINKTCRNAGHRWCREMRAQFGRSWVVIRACQRRGCDRMLDEWWTGLSTTYRLDSNAFVQDRHVVSRRRFLPT